MDNSGTIIESQVDWLTASAHGRNTSVALEQLAAGLQKEQKARGNRTQNWRLMGYEGTHCGAVEWGRRDENATIIRLIGDQASTSLADVLSIADQVTRIDVAVTWRATPPDPLLAHNTYALADMYHAAHPTSALPSKIEDAAGGSTCYLGKRESEYFFRLYNKGAEAVEKQDKEGAVRYAGCWRYELECKASVAKPIAETVANSGDPAAYIRNYVYSYCEQHGIPPAFPGVGAMHLIPGFRRRSDADSRLLHLAKNVRPTVRFLRSAGREADLREALEIDRTAHLLRELQWLLESDPARMSRSPREKGGEEGESNRG